MEICVIQRFEERRARAGCARRLTLKKELEIARVVGPLPSRDPLVDLDSFRKNLPEKAVFLDFVDYIHDRPKTKDTESLPIQGRMLVFVVNRDAPLRMIDLGSTKIIAAAVDEWFTADGKVKRTRAGAKLRRIVWAPLEKTIGKPKVLLVSPDGPLANFPLAAIPGKRTGRYLLHEFPIAVIPVSRLLPDWLKKANSTPKSLLAVGDIDYDAVAGGAPANPPKGKPFAGLKFSNPSVDKITKIFGGQFPDRLVSRLTRGQATETAFAKQAPRHTHILLSAHGFYYPPSTGGPAWQVTRLDHVLRSFAMAKDASIGAHYRSYFPDLQSGIVFAGANQSFRNLQFQEDLQTNQRMYKNANNLQVGRIDYRHSSNGKTFYESYILIRKDNRTYMKVEVFTQLPRGEWEPIHQDIQTIVNSVKWSAAVAK